MSTYPPPALDGPEGDATVADGGDPQAVAAMLRQAAGELDGVEAALRRLDDGTYGTCEVCRTPIPDVVDADPVGRRCPAHEVAPDQ